MKNIILVLLLVITLSACNYPHNKDIEYEIFNAKYIEKDDITLFDFYYDFYQIKYSYSLNGKFEDGDFICLNVDYHLNQAPENPTIEVCNEKD